MKARKVISILSTIFLLSSVLLFAQSKDKSVEVSTKVAKTEGEPNKLKSSEVSTSGGTSLFETVKSGGWVMIPIILMGFMGLTLIIERIIFFVRIQTWKTDKLQAELIKPKTSVLIKIIPEN